MPTIRLTRQGSIGQCNCKVGGCHKCSSVCPRCKCACNGISPLDTLCRRVGKQKKKPQLMTVFGASTRRMSLTKIEDAAESLI